ncbi:MAG TPA: hypothetical protein VHK01_05695 [Lacipirellulaceae bacterium]|nr:hypothetical protein [Lacipirellulaceae bacterium]
MPQRTTGGDQALVGRHILGIDDAFGDRLLSLKLDGTLKQPVGSTIAVNVVLRAGNLSVPNSSASSRRCSSRKRYWADLLFFRFTIAEATIHDETSWQHRASHASRS